MAPTDDINISVLNTLHDCVLHILGGVQLTEIHKPRHAESIGQLENTDWVPFLDGSMVRVEILQQRQEAMEVRLFDGDLSKNKSREEEYLQ